MAYYLGIDGGGSKTTCAVGDENSLLGGSTAGPSNITRVGEARARESLQRAIREGCKAANILPSKVQSACIGAAGAGRAEVATLIQSIVAELLPGAIDVVGDMPIALEAALGDGPGVIVIAGTGSIAYGRDQRGRTARAGGWGYAISDEGSAHWIGRCAVSDLLRAIDESVDDDKKAHAEAEGSPLFQELKALSQVVSLDELVRAANSNFNFATFFPAVVAASDRGDAVAQGVLARGAEKLAQIAAIIIRRLFSREKSATISLGLAGGVFCHASRVHEIFSDRIRASDPRVHVIQKIVEPVEGALQMARKMAPRKIAK